jgi:hypothetical protein
MKITVKDEGVKVLQGKSAKTGREYSMRRQQVTVETSDFRMPMQIILADDQRAYPVGEYTLDLDSSVEVNNYGELRFKRRIDLIPVPRTSAAKMG